MTSECEQLDWLAFQYVCGDLEPADREAFELQLLNSQAAREAVAGAVELCDAVKAAHALPVAAPAPLAVPERSSTWMSPAVWISLGAAACLFLVASLEWFSRSAGPESNLVERSSADDTDLALVWSDFRQFASEEASDVDESDDDPSVETTDYALSEVAEQADGPALFDSASWIMTALAEREGEDPVEEPAVN